MITRVDTIDDGDRRVRTDGHRTTDGIDRAVRSVAQQLYPVRTKIRACLPCGSRLVVALFLTYDTGMLRCFSFHLMPGMEQQRRKRDIRLSAT